MTPPAPRSAGRPRGSTIKTSLQTALRLWSAMRERRLGPLAPLVFVLLGLALLLGLCAAISPLAPFVYPLF